jgi:uncharacterized protein YciI
VYWLLFYDYVPDMLTRRGPVRPAHLEYASTAHESGILAMAGAFADTVDGAVFVFQAEGEAAVKRFVLDDPYVKAGLVTGWRVRPWNVVIGGEAGAPA